MTTTPLWLRWLYRARDLQARALGAHPDSARPLHLLWLLPQLAFLIALPLHFWLIDDAYITFRTVENFANGFGLTWNVTERVQAYTHPLWMFLTTALYLPTRSLPVAVWTLSAVCVVAQLVVLWRSAGGPWAPRAGALTLLLLASKAYMDFTSSGLENPLTYLFVAAYFAPALLSDASRENSGAEKTNGLTWRVLLASLAFVNRQDTILFFLPDLLWRGTRHFQRVGWRGFSGPLLAALPAIVWELFALLYYGFPFPNTYYAKLARTGISLNERLSHGYWYVENSLSLDPLTIPVIMAGMTAVFFAPRMRAPALGLLAYMLYVVSAGAAGTHMSGRFFSAPMLLAAMIVVAAVQRPLLLALPALLLLAFAPQSPARVIAGDYVPSGDNGQGLHGIIDLRYVAIVEGSALSTMRAPDLSDHAWMRHGLALRNAPERVHVGGPKGTFPIGFFGFGAGPEKFVVDRLGISDPLLARLPRSRRYSWLPGHVPRDLPEGYVESVRSGANLIRDPDLHEYYERLRLVTEGPLFSASRFLTILRFNLGCYRHRVDAWAERQAQRNASS